MIGKVEAQLDITLLDPSLITDEMLERCVKPAMNAAVQVIADAATDKLRDHQSAFTGTSQKWSKKAKERNENRMKLVDGVRTKVFVDKEQNTVSGNVFLADEVKHIGTFLEFNRPHIFWGKGESVRQGTPFMRPAYEEQKENAEQTFAEHMRRCLSRKKRSGIYRKTAKVLIAAGVVASLKALQGGAGTGFEPLPEYNPRDPLYGTALPVTGAPSETYYVAA